MGLISAQSGRRNTFSDEENKIVEAGVEAKTSVADIVKQLKEEDFDRSAASVRAKCKRVDENYTSGDGRKSYSIEEDEIIVQGVNEEKKSAKEISADLKAANFSRTPLSVQYRMGVLQKTEFDSLEELHGIKKD